MLLPCRKLYYAIEAVLYIAYYSKGAPISSRDIAREQGLPPRYLEQIMQRLVHGNILRGIRGPKGGYFLAREAHAINLADICILIEDDPRFSDVPPTTELGNKIVRPYWDGQVDMLREKLAETTLEHLCDRAKAQHIQNQNPAL